jgi:hypothetical protein
MLLGVIAAAIPLVALLGFTVDDALISARVAAELASGHGYRFNPSGPIVDAVTPLGFAPLLAPFASGGPLAAFGAARVIGAVAWLAAAAWLGRALARRGERRARFAPLVWVAVCAPLGAWPSSGMETGIVVALATFALAEHRAAPLVAGLAAAWRPELLPWAIVLGIGTSLARSPRPLPALGGWALAVAPAVVVAVARAALFGMAMPLAVLAKPSSLDDGLRYAAGATLLTGAPLLVLAPRVWRTLPRHDFALLVAALVHLPVLALAGGDWMPLYRLLVPVLPTFVWVAGSIAERASAWATLARLVAGVGVALFLFVGLAPRSRAVWPARAKLIAEARPALAGARRVATLDAGWVGAATDADVVDLAGVTDPRIARLPGSHTSKQLPNELLASREVDAVLALWDDSTGRWFRATDARVVALAEAARFSRARELPLAGTQFRYVLYRLR